MADLQNSSTLSATSPSTNRTAPAPAGPKLRDSCHACAYSKLKCSKEKPTCSRCARRGVKCEYIATKRGGRKHANRSVDKSINENNNSGSGNNNNNTITIDNASHRRHESSDASTKGPSAAIPITNNHDPIMPVVVALPSPAASATGSQSNLFQSHFTPPSGSVSSLQDFTSTEMEEILASPLPLSMPDISDTNTLSASNLFSPFMDSSTSDFGHLFDSYGTFESSLSDLANISNPCSPLNFREQPAQCTEDQVDYKCTNASDSSNFCLSRALDLMKDLFPSSACQGAENNCMPPSIKTVISKNEKAIEVVTLMVQCSCSQDGYLLAIISLIVFKVLAWYAAAAAAPTRRHTSRSSHPSSEQVLHGQDSAVVGSYYIDGENSSRMAAQVVLSELHRVQNLINQLSAKLKHHSVKHSGGADTPNSLGFSTLVTEPTVPLSHVMMAQLEVDLRRKLKTLSLELVEGLRRD